ncbi:2,3-bisphosphoglycerate-independent phosphoglycerate mutase [Candidatus Rhodobacter oscarellae]|uniref:2,3-bisphosphoglycerate-independent phosphoglycerate mutase n=1 Tax=Candidatus Rhodobacter oscarellae TaxID=1675527 RepID=A0A0J9ED64_9RHOB|nr:2,3-bisphosphoglycerate-independent phosphoglycerate mutase [Candidatus Rhodobacter lobularis]KMW60650.1 2,3-bisphosphoglycerate-independent phosphoglycerate mutase [Candidatus Rhodobacter lobularis]
MTDTKPVVLCILDGWGHREEVSANAPALAVTPNFDRISETCPSALIATHGPAAGLPSGQMGNSEVGHTNIGAGRVVAMDLGQIDLAIEDGSFFENKAIAEFAATVKAAGGTAHVMGLVSDGGVHSHSDHMVAALKSLTDQGVQTVAHVITDGRDVAPVSARGYLSDFAEKARRFNVGIASVSGRYFAMDRDNRWERVEKAYRAMVRAEGEAAESWEATLDAAKARGETDEFVTPTVLPGFDGIKDGDGVFFINFRSDRARQILAAIADPEFDGFETGPRPALAGALGMVNYSDRHNTYMITAYPKQEISNTLGEWVSKQGLRQFRLAETEKYPHVTFFLNGGVEPPMPGEDRHMAPSPKVATYDLQPEMSAGEVGDKLAEAIRARYDLIVVNFANPDMVGHTGDLGAAIKACEAVDEGLGKALEALEEVGGAMLVTADHGNCEVMVDPETGGPHTAHTTNLVPVILIGGTGEGGTSPALQGSAGEGGTSPALRDGRLADLAPTLLQLMGLEQPPEMTGISLIA